MTQQNQPTVDNFFDNVGGGGSPSAVLKAVDDFAYGVIDSQRVVDYIPFGKTEPEINKDGSTRQQLVVTLQTDLRNWQGVANVPVVDRDVANSPQKDPSEDDGKRAVYLPQYSNIQYAVAQATAKHNGGKPGPILDGGKLGIKVVNLKDTGKGNPLKEHAAVYEPPVASDGFFPPQSQGVNPTTGVADADVSTPAPAAQVAPVAEQAPAAAPATDPWTNQPATSKPPF